MAVDKPVVAIIGAGISGLASAWLIREELASAFPGGVNVVVLEQEAIAGGKIITVEDSGYRVEAGPNGFLDSKPWTLELNRRLGLSSELLASDDNARKRYIFLNGRLHRLPENPIAFLRSGLLSLKGKLRIMAELWQKPRPATDKEETLAHFARRRLGEEAYQRLLDPMVSGIFAGNPETMSLRSAFPRIFELERDYGGLFKATLKLAWQKRHHGRDSAGPAGPGGILTSYRQGLAYLTQTLAARLGEQVQFGRRVRAITKSANGFQVWCEGQVFSARAVVSASPAESAGQYFSDLLPDLAGKFQELPYSPMAVVALGYAQEKLPAPLDGFGFLIPYSENRGILGVLWSSSIFPNCRAPEGKVLIQVMIGGARRPESVAVSDAGLLTAAQEEVAHTMGITALPDYFRLFRWARAIPQYNVGHWSLRQAVEDVPRRMPGLWIAGNAFHGISVNDCTATAFRIAPQVREFISMV